MSTNELIPLFPSATHPAIPISAQILSTLRHLTRPGKGNDLKPEERAALVGIAALLGCEKIQSKDLLLSSAQKASSVSPANFRSALSRCRTLLQSIPSSPTISPSKSSPSRRSNRSTDNSPSKSRTSDSLSVTNGKDTEETEENLNVITPALSIRSEDLLSPLQTPKKKYKFSSGIDISSLVSNNKSPRTPRTYDSVIASPLRQSVTRIPSTAVPKPSTEEVEEDGGRRGEDGGTPSKKNKFHPAKGVDLEHPPETVKSVTSQRKRRNDGDSSAFFALRPGSSITPIPKNKRPAGEDEDGEGMSEGWMHRRPEETHGRGKIRKTDGERKKKKEKRNIDWTYTEGVWGGKEEENEKKFDNIWKDLDLWLEAHEMPSIDQTEVIGTDAVEIMLNALVRPDEGRANRNTA